MNSIETPEHRAIFRAATLGKMVNASYKATLLTVALSPRPPEEVIFNSTHQDFVACAMWLQEHGVHIPAELCAELEIEVRNA